MEKNDSKAKEYINSFFNEKILNTELNNFKDEILNNFNDQIWNLMKTENLSYDEAFEKSKIKLGDVKTLLSNYEKNIIYETEKNDPRSNYKNDEIEKPSYKKSFKKYSVNPIGQIILAVLIYVFVGIVFNNDFWWSTLWIIIPVTAILNFTKGKIKLITLSPFVYVGIGLITDSDFWWSTGWIIIPLAVVYVFFVRINKK